MLFLAKFNVNIARTKLYWNLLSLFSASLVTKIIFLDFRYLYTLYDNLDFFSPVYVWEVSHGSLSPPLTIPSELGELLEEAGL